jgi:hypothetical protein
MLGKQSHRRHSFSYQVDIVIMWHSRIQRQVDHYFNLIIYVALVDDNISLGIPIPTSSSGGVRGIGIKYIVRHHRL